MLLLTRRASIAMKAAAVLATRTMLTHGASPAQVAQAIQSSQATAIKSARRKAKDESRNIWQSATGLDVSAHDDARDIVRAAAAASALAHAWSKRQRALVDDDPDLSTVKSSRMALDDLSSSLERTADTESVHAWNTETSRLTDVAWSRGDIVVERWSALVDACPACWDLDGQSVVRPDRFPEDPPLHPRCRCILVVETESVLSEAA